mgnify:CR=1 FL=1
MRSYGTVCLLCLFGMALNAQSSAVQGVEKALNYYLDGGTNNDADMVAKAFHPAAELKFVTDEGYQEVSIDDFLARIKPGPKSNRKTSIKYINVTGQAASASVEIDYADFTFLDYFNLLEVDGEWKIVNKIFFKRMKEEKGS